MGRSKYTRALLEPLVATARSLSDVMRALGLPPTGGNHRAITAHIRLAGLDTSHFTYGRTRDELASIPTERLVTLAQQCTSVIQVLTALGLPTRGRPHREITARIRALGVDTTHFRGRGWARGETAASHPSVARTRRKNSFSDEVVFTENSPVLEGRRLVKRLLAKGWPYRCAWCEISEWRGAPLVLHLDHVNGTSNDNRLVNLRFLCPNCHSQTATYCNARR